MFNKAIDAREQRAILYTQMRGIFDLCVITLTLIGSVSAQTTTRVSVATSGMQAVDGNSSDSSISADGRYAAFVSSAKNLAPGIKDDLTQIYLHDRQTLQTMLLSTDPNGTPGNDYSWDPNISADGHHVAFQTYSSNILTGDTNDSSDILVYSLKTGKIHRASIASDGTQANSGSSSPSLSSDGRYLAFSSTANNLTPDSDFFISHIYVHDLHTRHTERISSASNGSPGNSSSYYPSISADGRHVAFWSRANNLTPGGAGDGWHIFTHDRYTGQNIRLSVAPDLTQGGFSNPTVSPKLSYNGRYIAFSSGAIGLIPEDSNEAKDIFVYDRESNQIQRVSIASDGTQGNNSSYDAAISADGRHVAFTSNASNLVPGDTNGTPDIFIHDRQTGQTRRVSVALDGTQGNRPSQKPFLSTEGRYAVFHSWANNLVPGDTNEWADVFVHDRDTPIPTITLTVPTSVPSCPGIARPMQVSWSAEGVSFCRASIPNAASSSAQPDQCLRGGGLPARGSFWDSSRCPQGQCPDLNDRTKLPASRGAHDVLVCQNLLGLAPPQTSVSLRLTCTTPSGGTLVSDRSVGIRAPVAGECSVPTYAAPPTLPTQQAAWGGGTELSGTVTGVPTGTELTASLLYEGTRGQTTVWMEGNTLKLLYRDNPGPQPPQITETVTVAVSDGVSSDQREYTFTVRSSYVFGSGFE